MYVYKWQKLSSAPFHVNSNERKTIKRNTKDSFAIVGSGKSFMFSFHATENFKFMNFKRGKWMASNKAIFHEAQWDVPNCYFMKRSENLPLKFSIDSFCTLEKLLNISWLKSPAHIVCYSSNSSRRCSSCPVKTFPSHSLPPSSLALFFTYQKRIIKTTEHDCSE